MFRLFCSCYSKFFLRFMIIPSPFWSSHLNYWEGVFSRIFEILDFDKPKSVSLRRPERSNTRFWGLRSLWIIPKLCRFSRAKIISAIYTLAYFSCRYTYCSKRLEKSPPYIYSRKKKWMQPTVKEKEALTKNYPEIFSSISNSLTISNKWEELFSIFTIFIA